MCCPAAFASDPADGSNASSSAPSTIVRPDPAQIRSYWTRERMREARPADVLLAGAGSVATGPQPTLHEEVDRREVTDTTTFPNRTHGKVFFTIPGEGDFVCSGTVVHSPSRRLAISTGHCVYDHDFCGGCWVSNWQFVPGYGEGQAPFGEWPARRLASTPGWVEQENLSYDVGAAVLRRRTGEGIEDVVGARGIAFNTARDQTYQAYGYPAAQPPLEFDGEHLFVCSSGYGGADDPPGGGPDTMLIACDMTAGASGGGWVINGRRVASVISYGFLLGLDDLYGPYFGNKVRDLYLSVRGRRRPAR